MGGPSLSSQKIREAIPEGLQFEASLYLDFYWLDVGEIILPRATPSEYNHNTYLLEYASLSS